MQITREELERVARIARLPLEEGEVPRLREELDAVLEDLAALTEVPDGPRATGMEDAAGALREDLAEPAPRDEVVRIVDAFPRRSNRLLKVPRGL